MRLSGFLRYRFPPALVRAAALSAALVTAFGFAHNAAAIPISGLYNTGVDATNNPLADGAVDPHYTLVASDDPGFPGPNAIVAGPIPGAWLPNVLTVPASKWIAPRAPQSGEPAGDPAGSYVYRVSFDLTGLDPAEATLAGSWAVADIGLIMLNGSYVEGTTNLTGAGSLTPFSITDGFVTGVNYLDFVVVNTATGPTGLRVQGLSGDAPVIPEPATLVLMGIGVASTCLVYGRRRHQRSDC